MADEIDTRVSISLDPGVYRSIDGYEQHGQYVGSVVNAVNDAYVTVGELHDARRAADANPGWTPEQRIENVGRVAEKQKARVVKKVELAERDLAANITHTEAQLREPLMERAGLGSLNGEVRAYARGLKPGERGALIRDAMEADDGPTLEAILGAQPFLSGLSKEEHDYHVWRYHARRNPHLVARLETMQRFRDRLAGIGPILDEQFKKAVGAEPSVVETLKAASDRAMAALDIKPKP